MKEINVTALRKDLPAYVARAERGERVRVTARGKVVAELGPPSVDVVEADRARARLRGSVRRYDQPLAPVFGTDEWEVQR